MSERSGETVENNGHLRFPLGLRVLVADENVVCLKIMSALLRKCNYQVMAERSAAEALKLLKKKKDKFDILLTDVAMHDIDGFNLMKMGMELDIPVIMVSANESIDIIEKGLRYGACHFLPKPLTDKEIKNIWQHVYRKNIISDSSTSSSPERGEGGSVGNKRKVGDETKTFGDSGKRERFRWSKTIHDKFVDAVERLGGTEKAIPKKIMEIIGVDGVTREQVASHLQKYRKVNKEKQKSINHHPTNISHTLGGLINSLRVHDRVRPPAFQAMKPKIIGPAPMQPQPQPQPQPQYWAMQQITNDELAPVVFPNFQQQKLHNNNIINDCDGLMMPLPSDAHSSIMDPCLWNFEEDNIWSFLVDL